MDLCSPHQEACDYDDLPVVLHRHSRKDIHPQPHAYQAVWNRSPKEQIVG